MEKLNNYRGVYPANIVTILEGDGTPGHSYENVRYVLGYKNTEAGIRLTTLGKMIDLTEEDKSVFE